jgi:O-antigen ligase
VNSLSGVLDIRRVNLLFVAMIALSVAIGIMGGANSAFSLKIMFYVIVLLNVLMVAYLFLLKNMTYGLLVYFYGLVFLNFYWRIGLPGKLPDLDIPRVTFIFIWVIFLLEIGLGKRHLLPRARPEPVMLVLVVAIIASMIMYRVPRIRLLLNGFAIPYAMFILAKNVYVRKADLDMLLYFWAVPLAFYFPINLLFENFGLKQFVFPKYILSQAFQAQSKFFGERPVGPFLQPVVTGFAIVTVFLLALYALSKLKGMLPRLASVALCIITPAGVFVTYTRSVYLGLVVPLIILAVYGKKLRKYGVVLIVAALLVVMGNWNAVKSENRSAGGLATRHTAIGRLVLLQTSLRMFRDRPFTGFGFDQFEASRMPYVRQVRTTLLGARAAWQGKTVKQHNQFLLVLTELGLMGFVPLCLVYYFVIRMLWNARKVMTDVYDYEFVVVVWCIMAAYLANVIFINPTFFEFMNAMPMTFAGIVAGGYQRANLLGWRNNGKGERSFTGEGTIR